MRFLHLSLTFLCLLCFACSDIGEPVEPGLAQLDAAVNGMTLEYVSGRTFVLVLDSYADAGYRWECETSDSTVVCPVGSPRYQSKNPGVDGGLSSATFLFSARKPGRCRIYLMEHQQWMKGVPPRAEIQFHVVVRSAGPDVVAGTNPSASLSI